MAEIESGVSSSHDPGSTSELTSSASSQPSDLRTPMDREEQIRQLAYARYEKRGYEEGHEVEDWLAAESEVNGLGDFNPDMPAATNP